MSDRAICNECFSPSDTTHAHTTYHHTQHTTHHDHHHLVGAIDRTFSQFAPLSFGRSEPSALQLIDLKLLGISCCHQLINSLPPLSLPFSCSSSIMMPLSLMIVWLWVQSGGPDQPCILHYTLIDRSDLTCTPTHQQLMHSHQEAYS